MIVLTKPVNPKYEKFLDYSIYIALIAYAAGLITSISLLAVAHIMMLIPCIYFATITDWKKMPKSSWALLAFTISIVLSVIVNIEIMKNGWKPALKSKYFIYGLLSIIPLFYFFKEKLSHKRKKILIALILTSSIVSLVGGTIGKNTGFNPITMRYVETVLERNAGLMGMVLNFAHNLAYFLTIFATLLIAFWRDINKREKIIYCTLLALNIYSLYTTYTRGAILAFIAGIIGYSLKDKRKLIITFIVLSVVGVAGYFASYKSFKREGSDDLRLGMWKTAIFAYVERPVFGWGYLNFEQHSRDIKRRHEISHLEFGGHAHNSILEVMAATGTVGIISFFAWIGFWVFELFSRKDKWAQVELAALCALFVGGLTQSTIGLGINLFFIMLIYSVSAAHTLRQRNL